MTTLQSALPAVVAAGIPFLFLLVAYSLDLYSSHSPSLVALAFLWGGILGVGVAYSINTYVARPLIQVLQLRHILMYVAFAPFVEELVKMLPLTLYTRIGRLTFFVDGAIYGFAAGIGFSIGETFLYISQYPDLAIPLALGRALSTSLMHGAATALVGIGYGLARLRRFKARRALAIFAWCMAVLFHGLFNAVAISDRSDLLGTLGAMLIGIGSFELLLLCIRLGLKQEKRWLEERLDPAALASLAQHLAPVEQQELVATLGHASQISLAEIKAAREYEQIDEFLDPLREQFPEQADKMEWIILQQAQIGIKRRLMWEVDSPKLQARLQAEIGALEDGVRRLRKQVGVCAMSYLDCVFDEEGQLMQVCVETVTACADPWDEGNPVAPQIAPA